MSGDLTMYLCLCALTNGRDGMPNRREGGTRQERLS